MIRKSLLACITVSMLGSMAAAQETAPKPPQEAPAATTPASHATPAKEKIYDENADANTQIATALAAAKKNNRRVLIQWGANWCGWCHLLHGTFTTDKDIKKKLNYEYDWIEIDVGHSDKNMDLVAKYGADLKTKGLPYLTVLDADGKVVTNQETGALENKGDDATGHDPAKVMAFLTKNQATYLQAESVLADGLAKAKAEHKSIFLHVGAPWCYWCHRLEDWMAKPEVAAVMGKDLVDLKIDQDRMIGGNEVFQRFNPKPRGIPWFALLDESGKVICTSDGPDGNIGFPGEPAEISHFIGMMTKVKKNMSDADLAALKSSLEKDKAPGHS